MPKNNSLPTEWNLNLLFPDPDPETLAAELVLLEAKAKAFAAKWRGRQDYLEEPTAMKEALDDYEEWRRLYADGGRLWFYFFLRSEQNENDPKIRAEFNRANEFAINSANETQFFALNIANISPAKQAGFLNSTDLAPYKHFLEKLFAEGKYLLSEAEERILNLKSMPAYSAWTRMLSGFLSRETRQVLTDNGAKEARSFNEIQGMLQTGDRAVADSVGAAVNDILASHVDIAESEMNAILQNKKIDDDLRGVLRPDAIRHLSDDMDSVTVDSLLRTVEKNFEIAHDFYALKAKLLGAESLPYHQRGLVYGNISQTYSYDEALGIVRRVFAGLDPEFAEILDRFVSEGRIDVYPRVNKRGGAFCMAHLLPLPVYVLLNYTGKVRDITTIAHELGHGINDELVKRSQNALNFETPTAMAEVASTFMEDFVIADLEKTADPETKLAYKMTRLEDDVATVFRQVAAYRFEQELHQAFRQDGYLAKETIGALFQKHMSAYMGPAIEQSPGSENWWVAWHHFRMYFYVYSYSGGLLVSKYLQRSVRRDPEFISKVKGFLSAGSSDSPRAILAKLGVSLDQPEFWQEGLLEIAENLKSAEKLASRLKKI